MNGIRHRDTINYVQNRISSKGIEGTGLAYKIAEDTRRGIYSRTGIPAEIKGLLKHIGVSDWFLSSIERIKYLFPKAHGVTYVRLAAILMWYKIHYPREFSEILLS